VPHTWKVEAETTDYHGVAWYHRSFQAPDEWTGQCVRLEFEAVYHSATVWVNEKQAGEHLRKGYTAFAFDVSDLVKPGEENTVVVRVDNEFSDRMLPRGTSYDWAGDGGIARPVNLLVTPPVYADRLAIDAHSNLDRNTAEATVSCRLHNTTDTEREVALRCRIAEEDTGRWVPDQTLGESVAVPAGGTKQVELTRASWEDPMLWHFDHPHLHHAVLDVRPDEGQAHREAAQFGVRSITVSDGHFYLNGEPVSLMGVERMAGVIRRTGWPSSGTGSGTITTT
jgi:beta-glucuronidase